MERELKVLIIDDEELICWSLQRSFERGRSVSVHCAFSAAEAMGFLKEQEYDVIITDLRLPDAHGFDILGMIQLAASEASVIVLSSYASEDMVKHMLSEGIVRCMSKPFELDDIVHEAWRAAGLNCAADV